MTTPITDMTVFVTRARAILATIVGIGTDLTAGADFVQTPGYEVFLKSGRHERQAGTKKRVVTRVLSMRIYYALLEDPTNEAHLRNARNLTQAAVEGYVDTIFNRVNLSLGTDAGIVTTGDAEDSLGIMPYGNQSYYGFDIDLTIFYNRG